ncbi:Conserved hypothetical protein [Shewanella piezotolerans WP3]|uniref:Transposase n=1 Tax=Shewanella piezotolerans (strain WP3 / JCM 13877) TaxID=225849 RepID=B8CIL1_SHEPW|nr:hypothetical protein [Shewanella piezotolerans]ACJ27487.1 Conserved hypothetical protein [Shewanella piezotolerans WP3]
MTPIKHELSLRIIDEVKNNRRLLSDVARQYGLPTKAVYQLVSRSEQPESRFKILKLEIEQLRNRISKLSNEVCRICR